MLTLLGGKLKRFEVQLHEMKVFLERFHHLSSGQMNYRYMSFYCGNKHDLIKKKNHKKRNYNGTESLINNKSSDKLERIGSSELTTIHCLLGRARKRGVW